MNNAQKYWYLPLTFSGRLNRLRFLLANLMLSAVCLSLALLLSFLTFDSPAASYPLLVLEFVWSFSLVIRRLHDLDAGGWFSLLIFVPLVNLVFLLYVFLKKGTAGPNKYGADPLEELKG